MEKVLSQEEINNLTFNQKLLRIIFELKVKKERYNKHGKFNFRSAEDILEAVKPIAFKYGLLPNLTDEIILIGDRYYVKATATITDGTSLQSSIGYARETEKAAMMNESQTTGSSSSYARKYALNGLFLIDDGQDADSDMASDNQSKPQQKKQYQSKPQQNNQYQNNQYQSNQQQNNFENLAGAATDNQKKYLIDLIDEHTTKIKHDKKEYTADLMRNFGVAKWNELTAQQASNMINHIKGN